MAYRNADPYWLIARYAGACSKCNAAFAKATRVFYYPNGKRLLSGACAEAAAAEFSCAAADEAFYNS
jgi:hypothetical protein